MGQAVLRGLQARRRAKTMSCVTQALGTGKSATASSPNAVPLPLQNCSMQQGDITAFGTDSLCQPEGASKHLGLDIAC